jgi:hypothetical protein
MQNYKQIQIKAVKSITFARTGDTWTITYNKGEVNSPSTATSDGVDEARLVALATSIPKDFEHRGTWSNKELGKSVDNIMANIAELMVYKAEGYPVSTGQLSNILELLRNEQEMRAMKILKSTGIEGPSKDDTPIRRETNLNKLDFVNRLFTTLKLPAESKYWGLLRELQQQYSTINTSNLCTE